MLQSTMISLIIVACVGALFVGCCVSAAQWMRPRNATSRNGQLFGFWIGMFSCGVIGCLLLSDFVDDSGAAWFAGSLVVISVTLSLVLSRIWSRTEAASVEEAFRVRKLLEQYHNNEQSLDDRCSRSARMFDLTRREEDMLRLFLGGRSQREIAEELFVSKNTVKSHTRNLYRKMGVTSRENLLEKTMSSERHSNDIG